MRGNRRFILFVLFLYLIYPWNITNSHLVNLLCSLSSLSMCFDKTRIIYRVTRCKINVQLADPSIPVNLHCGWYAFDIQKYGVIVYFIESKNLK